MKNITLSITTAANGSATVNDTTAILGELYAIEYRPGTIATGATITVTCEGGGSKPLLTKASAGTANSWYYPRDLVHAVADGAALTGTSGGDRCKPILSGRARVVVASGGSGGVGTVEIYYKE